MSKDFPSETSGDSAKPTVATKTLTKLRTVVHYVRQICYVQSIFSVDEDNFASSVTTCTRQLSRHCSSTFQLPLHSC